MKILNFLFLLFFFCIGAQEQPPAHDFPRIRSSVAVPVRIPLSEISSLVNASVKDLIFEDQSYTDNNNDQFKVKVWKTRPIRLVGGTKQNLLIEVPLRIWAEKGIGTLGVYSYQNTNFETVMYFNTEIALLNNWTMVTKTSPMGFKWVSKPMLDFGKIKIPVTNMVEASLRKQQLEFSKKIDELMLRQLDLQPYAVLAWNQFAQPFHVSEEYSTWLKITPVGVKVTPLVFYGNAIDVNIGIDTYSETFTGNKPQAATLVKKVQDFASVPSLPDRFLLQTTANIPFSEATRIGQQLFLDREFDFLEGKSKIKINGVKVYGELDRVIIEATTAGTVDGTSVISGIPVYDEVKRMIVLSDTTFKLKTKNILQKGAALLFRNRIVNMIEEEYGIPTAEIEDMARKGIHESFNREYYKGLKMSGKVLNLKPSKIIMNPNGLTAVIDTEAQLHLMVQGL
ncbi:MAG: DUF4403 family protein [Weeksellaceae bacterium]|nr:DUF4403 family protein [Weeksellaceae bacterium]